MRRKGLTFRRSRPPTAAAELRALEITGNIMSVSSGYVRCHGCSFEGVMQHRPITLEYRLPSGETVTGYRRFAWCATCKNITEAEDLIESNSIHAEIKAIEQRNRGIAKRLFGFSREDSAEIKSLQAKLRLAQARHSPPRCLRCGESEVKPLEFNSNGTSKFIHSCGQRLFLVPENPDVPRFMYRPEVIRLDADGRRI